MSSMYLLPDPLDFMQTHRVWAFRIDAANILQLG